MSLSVQVPATGGAKGTVVGRPIGDFLIHENAKPLVCEDHDPISLWSVTYRRLGLRFPWSFLTAEAAEKFADEVRDVMDFDAVKTADLKEVSPKAEWVAGKPTKEQTSAVIALAKERGGIRCDNTIT